MTAIIAFLRRQARRLRAWWILRRHGGKTSALLTTAETPSGSKPTAAAERFTLGERVGSPGGQGAVYAVVGQPGLVYKQYNRPLAGAADSFTELMSRAPQVNRDLSRDIQMTWPIHLFGHRHDVDGYTMIRVPDDHFVEVVAPNGNVTRHLGLAYAVPREVKFRPKHPATGADRLALATLIGTGFDALHRQDVLYRDLSWANIAYALDPPRVVFMDMDSARPLEVREVSEKDGVDTPDWQDPFNPGGDPIGFDLDRFKYALLVYRLLAVGHLSADLPTLSDLPDRIELVGVPTTRSRHIANLFRRVAAGPGKRPPVSEWLDLLAR